MDRPPGGGCRSGFRGPGGGPGGKKPYCPPAVAVGVGAGVVVVTLAVAVTLLRSQRSVETAQEQIEEAAA